MKILNKCNQCGHNAQIRKCDECGKVLSCGIPIEINFGYGSFLDMLEVDFCTLDCTITYLINERNKCNH